MRDDGPLAELPLVIELRIDIDGIEVDLLASARSQYRATRVDDAWRIVPIISAARRYQAETPWFGGSD